MAEKIHPENEQGCIQDSGNQNPFPQLMFDDKPVGLKIRLYGNDHFFQHNEGDLALQS